MNFRYKKSYIDFKRPALNPIPNRNFSFKPPSPIKKLPPPNILKRIALYGLAFIAISYIWSYKSSENEQIELEYQKIAEEQKNLIVALEKSMENYQAPAPTVLNQGIKFVKANQFEFANLLLERAGELDPNLRDAFVYAGFSQIQLAIENKSDQVESQATMRKAVDVLNQAATIDPLHSYTFELLIHAYEFLGERENADQARRRAQTVALQ